SPVRDFLFSKCLSRSRICSSTKAASIRARADVVNVRNFLIRCHEIVINLEHNLAFFACGTGNQRVRESNPCTSLERAYVFPRVRLAVATLLLESGLGPARFCWPSVPSN